MKKLNNGIIKRMKQMRRNGCVYAEIEKTLHVSHWSTCHHLSGIERGSRSDGKQTQLDSVPYLKSQGFSHIIDLNSLYPNAEGYDLVAIRNGELWFLDATENRQKTFLGKPVVLGAICAICYHDRIDNHWELLKIIKMEQIQ